LQKTKSGIKSSQRTITPQIKLLYKFYLSTIKAVAEN